MNIAIPVFPCLNIKEQVEFYKNLGFEVPLLITNPYPYAVVTYEEVEINFYVLKSLKPQENSNVCIIKVDDVDIVHAKFINNLKNNLLKISSKGFPRISKIRVSKEDKRFTISDINGNTFFVLTPHINSSMPLFFRTIENTTSANDFKLLYDLVYSKEDNLAAMKLLPRLIERIKDFNDLDKAKFFLIEIEIKKQLNLLYDDKMFLKIINNKTIQADDLKQLTKKYEEIMWTE